MIDIIPTGLALGRAPWRHSAHLESPLAPSTSTTLVFPLVALLATRSPPRVSSGITEIIHTGLPSVALVATRSPPRVSFGITDIIHTGLPSVALPGAVLHTMEFSSRLRFRSLSGPGGIMPTSSLSRMIDIIHTGPSLG
ncbi:hypothetical protein CF319_g9393 [Tilletia indica]|nr:hypothetical protein CF319_g9393 [Tilletia indica]